METLAYSRYVPLLAQEIKIWPNTKPESQKLFGIDIPGAKKYLASSGLRIFRIYVDNLYYWPGGVGQGA